MTEVHEEGIDNARQVWINSINNGDANLFDSILSEDVVWVLPQRDAMIGRREVGRWIHSAMTSTLFKFSVLSTKVRLAGRIAIEYGQFSTLTRMRGTDSFLPAHRSSYVLVWCLRDDGWRIDRYLDCSEWFG